MVTAETYNGKAGYSMRLEGMEKGFNDKVRARDIVMHGSDYVNEYRMDDPIGMGRSYGCPAVPFKLHKKIIDTIKNGSCFFMFGEDNVYASSSGILNTKFNWPSLMPVLPAENMAGNGPVKASAALF